MHAVTISETRIAAAVAGEDRTCITAIVPQLG
jgi:hypothetical protein